MYRAISFFGILLLVTASWADELPQPRKVDEANTAGADGNRDLTNLRNDIAKLQAAREALRTERLATAQTIPDTSKAEEIRRLQQRLAEAVKRWEAAQKQQAKVEPPPTTIKPPVVAPTEKGTVTTPSPKVVEPPQRPMTDGPVDALALGPVLFQTGDYEGALTAYKLLNLQELGEVDRMTVLYMTAACMRKLGKTDDAAALFREVANSKSDATLVECAQWQLSAIRWKRDVETKLEEMRQRRKTLEAHP